MTISITDVKFDCRFFRGDIPCKPNKLRGKICNTCDEYAPIKTRILIIKLGAIGDVIRTTPLVSRFKKEYPDAHISWITLTPDVVPLSLVDKVYPFDFKSIYSLTHQKFDIAINLDKDHEACSLLNDVYAIEKYGFSLRDGQVYAINHLAEHKLLTGLFDQLSQTNTKNYLEEIFEICNFDFQKEEYVLDIKQDYFDKWKTLHEKANGKKIIGLNTGCGSRWLTRLWPEQNWIELIKRLQNNGYFPLLLGGKDEDEMNRLYAEKTGAYYPGTFTLPQFFSLSAQCNVILTAVSMMMHIALAAKIPLALFVNIFNPHEFELYERGIMIQPTTGCDCYFGNSCTRENHCMNDISVDQVYQDLIKLLDK